MPTITYKTETNPICNFTRLGTISEIKEKLAFIMEGVQYEIISESE